ncbi:hypothetical protein B0T26DRAFT_873711 [Lasiosphaeria miniovina]|uniref:Uncharacterized protein n=1 Tax=Lasiosphaeria miniovina TaxID=1954250 RepID=A0AA40ACY7_9PEZI|nr:uncharacterized protein B0T26DRAFT_873711 [Lasiosphaeria miniovina]KAK0713609.1 hypothetical protein B0T26DRAFT_873711 [Lasiosphaeria miniovina]
MIVQTVSPTSDTLKYQTLWAVLQSAVYMVEVDFLEGPNKDKCHVVLGLRFDPPVRIVAQRGVQGINFSRAELSVEKQGAVLQSGGKVGCVKLKLRTYNSVARSSQARFAFNTPDISLLDFMDVVFGTHYNMDPIFQINLGLFNFSMVYNEDAEDELEVGCRDWISQVFIRLHHLGWVEWWVDTSIPQNADIVAKLTPNPDFDVKRLGGTLGFHDIISKVYQWDGGYDPVFYRGSNVTRGIFLDTAGWIVEFGHFTRDHTNTYAIPYNTTASSSSSSSGGVQGTGAAMPGNVQFAPSISQAFFAQQGGGESSSAGQHHFPQ